MHLHQWKRRDFITLLGGAAAWPLAARAQQPRSRRFRIGWLTFGGPTLGALERTLRDAISERGLIQGQNIEVTFRYANGMSTALSGLAEELVAQRPDLLIGLGGDVAKVLFDASKGSIPVVGGVSDDPVRAELAVSLGRPGKSFTGATFISDELAAKRIELLNEVAPAARRVAVIWNLESPTPRRRAHICAPRRGNARHRFELSFGHDDGGRRCRTAQC